MDPTSARQPGARPPRGARSDGEQSRERLLHAALRLFAEQGFAKTSTREIADAAGTNLAAISYYFGDKAGLYRAAFTLTQAPAGPDVAAFADRAMPLEDALRLLYTRFVAPLREGEVALQCMKLHMREMLEPTGVWEAEIREAIAPRHRALAGLLRRHLGLARVDAEVDRLVFALTALGLHVQICADVTAVVAPSLHGGDDAFDRWIDRLTAYGLALVEAERQRRATARPAARPAAARQNKNGRTAAPRPQGASSR